MNNSYYSPNNMGFEQVPNIPSGNNDLPMEQSYVENILRLNKGKIASFYNIDSKDILVIHDDMDMVLGKIRVVYDKCLTKSQKKTLCKTDIVLERTLHAADKNYAHKDDDYIPSEIEFEELIRTLKQRIEHCKEVCKENLPKCLTLDYVSYDRDLYRFINGISPKVEIELQKKLFPNYTKTFKEVMGKKL